METDAIWCRRAAAEYASSLGFDKEAVWTISIVVSELVTNAIKYAKGGKLFLSSSEKGPPGIEIKVDDDGPGCMDIQTALQDGFSEGRRVADGEFVHDRRGLGTGLGAVERFMDEVRITNKEEGGLTIVAVKYL